MTVAGDEGILALVSGRRGHFRLESGHHGELWLDLDSLFSQPARVEPLISRLAEAIRPHAVDVVCGPLLGGAFLAQRLAQLLGTDFWHTERVMPPGPRSMFAARYLLPGALSACASGRRVAMVDDVMSAGSALRGSCSELRAHGAVPVVAGALMVLGTLGADFFAAEGIPVEAVGREPYPIWPPGACPHCAAGEPLEDVAVAPAPTVA